MISRLKNALTGFALVLFIFISSCKEPNEVGLEVLPSNDSLNVKFSDTSTLYAFTIPEDSLPASGAFNNLAGSYIDPVFGVSRAGFFTQVAPSKLAPDFGVDPQADSVILSLGIAGTYGDTTIEAQNQIFNVYLVTQDLSKDSSYYSNTPIAFGQLIGSSAPVSGSTDTILRFKLDASFFTDFILKQSGQPTLASAAAFQTYFKGIYVTPNLNGPQGTGNRIYYFDLSFTDSKIQVYYRNPSFDKRGGEYAINFNKNACVAINHFYHNYQGTPVAAQLQDSSLGAQLIYIQSMAGVKTKIRMPYLKNFTKLFNGNISINKAELVFTANPSDTLHYFPATSIQFDALDAAGLKILAGSFYQTNDVSSGNYLRNSGEYKIDISRYIQQVMSGKITDNGLFIRTKFAVNYGNRVVLQGTDAMNPNKIKLNITYSIFN